ncbi:LPXTG cell wall anchor domain-containing protein [Streptococcus sinensis]|nr:LPXTG cell wall anchor domain-containing protein [Streptococcus sinensis]
MQKENDRKLPSTGQTMSMVGVIGGVLLSALGFVFYLEKRRNHKA